VSNLRRLIGRDKRRDLRVLSPVTTTSTYKNQSSYFRCARTLDDAGKAGHARLSTGHRQKVFADVSPSWWKMCQTFAHRSDATNRRFCVSCRRFPSRRKRSSRTCPHHAGICVKLWRIDRMRQTVGFAHPVDDFLSRLLVRRNQEAKSTERNASKSVATTLASSSSIATNGIDTIPGASQRVSKPNASPPPSDPNRKRPEANSATW
jgi:hypothetical protein